MLTRRTVLLSGAALAACATPPAAADQTEAFNAYHEAQFEARLDRDPQFATQLGDKRGYDRWTDPSAAGDAAESAALEAWVAGMKAQFDPARLSADAQLTWRLAESALERDRAQRPWREHAYIFNQMFGAQSTLPVFLMNQHRVDTVADAEAYVARLNGLKPHLEALTARSQDAARRGILPPRFVFDYVLADCRNLLAGAPFAAGADAPLWADAQRKIAALDAPDAQKAQLAAAARAALTDSVQPAYLALIAALTAQQAQASQDDGVWRLPDGEAYYAHQLAMMTTTAMSAREIHELGLAEVARIENEMRALARQVNFAGDLPAFFRHVEGDPRHFLPNTPEGKAEYIVRARAALDAMSARLPDYFATLPRAPLEVRAVEAFREQSAGLAFYQRPAQDGSRPGIYYANTQNMRGLPLYQLEALAYHEGVPGHHMQLSIAQESEGVPRFRRLAPYTAYSEGWGLYCEGLAKDMGFYQDPYSDFGRLTLELRRAIRLVVDTGLHDKRWTRQQAIDYILATQPGEEDQARRDIDRYIVMPGQATAYKIGQLEILRLREAARARLGARFDIRAFHDLVLRAGPMPLDMLRARVDAWSGA
ncbi:MAG: DUF885 domain-containing protein [Hyphomonadaceae bacterium]|nr:DUF885 domain-containing protein [Hyphomonadaceae bacterium]